MNLKVMPRSNKGHKYILCIIDEVTKSFNNGNDTLIKIRSNR